MSTTGRRSPLTILCTAILAILWAFAAPSARAQPFAGGSGTPDDPYQVATVEQLIAVGRDANLQTGHFVLTADIDLSGIPFTGAVIPRFSGTFDGGHRVIRNLTIQGEHRIGLFGEVMDWARVSNLRVEDVNVVGTSTLGALVGHNLGVVHNCHATGLVKGTGGEIGGLVGGNEDGCITWCSSACTVVSVSTAGGLVGSNYGRVVNCSSTGVVSGKENVGGLVGNNGRDVISCYSSAAVAAESKVGGFIGTGGGTLVNCYSRGKVVCPWQSGEGTGNPSYDPGSGVGGFIGYSVAVIAHCFWNVDSSGQAVGVVWPRYHEDRKGDDPVGLSTAEMRDVRTYLEAGWDFAGETENGLADTWEMAADGYPVLRALYESGRPFSAGRGTAEDPYLISEVAELAAVCYEPWACYRLTQSIDLNGVSWSMGVVPLFGGMFDGHGFVIRNLTIKGNRPVGLFGELARGSCVGNLAVEDVNVAGTGSVGALVGTSRGTVMNCYSTGVVRGNSYVGGLLGTGDAVNCYSTARVEGQEYVNGLTASGYATHCYSVGAIAGGKIGLGHFVDVNTFGPLPYASTWGLTTAQMMDANTFLAAGWDFVGETTNGIAETWQMPDGGGYPVLSVFNGYVPPLAGGRGTREDPFLIATAQGLGAMSCNPGACYKLVESIDLSATQWSTPVVPCFYGSFDGNDLAIRGVSIKGESDLGFVGILLAGHARVENLSITDVNVAGDETAGGLIANVWGGSIRNCSCTGTVRGGRWGTGGLVGKNSGGSLADCTGDVAVSSTEGHVGGLVGDNDRGHILNCHINAVVCGTNPRDITNNTGGLVGTNADGWIQGCSTAGVVLGEGLVGGLAGWTSGDVIGSISDANVTGTGEVGGLAGSAHGNPRIRSCCNRGAVTGQSRTAGLVGRMDSGSLTNCYSIGRVTSTDWYPLGGVVSETGGEIEVTGCFWDSQVSGVRGSLGGMGLTTREMMDATTYALNGWANDPNWIIDDGKDYPRLAWEQKPGRPIPEPVIDWLDGSGDEETPYLIATRDQLLLLGCASILWDQHFLLTSDLDLAGVDMGRIGAGPGDGFTGSFDGGGHVIRNLAMKTGPSSAWHLGLFGYVDGGGKISRLGVENAVVAGGYWSNDVGALVGYVRQGTVDRCHSTGSVSTGYRSFRTGGLIGRVSVGDITNCWSSCDVRGGGNAGSIGGLVGSNDGDIAFCCAKGRVSSDYGTIQLGGLVGANGGNLANSYATGSVGEWGSGVVGGLAGSNSGGGTIDKCFSAGAIAGSSAWGLVGDNYRATVTNSFWDIETSGKMLSDGGIGLSTAELQAAGPFLNAGWDFESVWTICEGKDYPRFQWEGIVCE